jgi:hypothetical protein
MSQVEIEIDVEDQDTLALWAAVGELTEKLPDRWVLIGALMVQLHALEHGVTDVRPTRDIDILARERPPGALQSIARALDRANFKLIAPDLDGYAHRYERDKLIVDLLAPDGMKAAPGLGGGLKAIGVPGGSQAISRAKTITVIAEGRAFELCRPTLLGALLIKVRSLMVHDDPDTQREDLLRLLALIDDPREMAAELLKTERNWLRNAEQRLNLAGSSGLDTHTTRRADLAYRLLVRNS